MTLPSPNCLVNTGVRYSGSPKSVDITTHPSGNTYATLRLSRLDGIWITLNRTSDQRLIALNEINRRIGSPITSLRYARIVANKYGNSQAQWLLAWTGKIASAPQLDVQSFLSLASVDLTNVTPPSPLFNNADPKVPPFRGYTWHDCAFLPSSGNVSVATAWIPEVMWSPHVFFQLRDAQRFISRVSKDGQRTF